MRKVRVGGGDGGGRLYVGWVFGREGFRVSRLFVKRSLLDTRSLIKI